MAASWPTLRLQWRGARQLPGTAQRSKFECRFAVRQKGPPSGARNEGRNPALAKQSWAVKEGNPRTRGVRAGAKKLRIGGLVFGTGIRPQNEDHEYARQQQRGQKVVLVSVPPRQDSIKPKKYTSGLLQCVSSWPARAARQPFARPAGRRVLYNGTHLRARIRSQKLDPAVEPATVSTPAGEAKMEANFGPEKQAPNP